jgi:hypothetical protein
MSSAAPAVQALARIVAVAFRAALTTYGWSMDAQTTGRAHRAAYIDGLSNAYTGYSYQVHDACLYLRAILPSRWSAVHEIVADLLLLKSTSVKDNSGPGPCCYCFFSFLGPRLYSL